ncbi:MAG: hypothetical protein FWF00_00425 [Endomicrobia bacterium]|nr:hypothetical protein [Endomicrobiia bacterium]MCL2506143.1 hypothetical protein [Endomicrobiia bacterium]
MFAKYFLALFATLFLGPGVGHIFLRQYRKAFILIGTSILILIAAAIVMSFTIDLSSVPREYAAMREYLKNLMSQNTNLMLMINLPLALVWAYAFADIGRGLYDEYKEYKKTEGKE